MRATICVDVSSDDERAVVEGWFDRWRDRLAFVSENEGCGCCVDMWNVEGPDDAIAELPNAVRAVSEPEMSDVEVPSPPGSPTIV